MQDLDDPYRLPPIGFANAVAARLQAWGAPKVPLHADAMLERAARDTGLSDFGDDTFLTPYGILVESLREEAPLNFFGQVTARVEIGRLLRNRLQMVDAWTSSPAMLDAPIEKPVFIVGLPRSGTTILYNLLSCDPGFTVPATWQATQPIPVPDPHAPPDDPRIRKMARELAFMDRMAPDFKKVHPLGAELPQECLAMQAHTFESHMFVNQFDVPAYADWMWQTDWSAAFAWHRKQLQLMQSRTGPQPWLLKSPSHLWTLGALLDEYPDATIVQTHRDPVECIPSFGSLICILRGLASDDIDPVAVAAEWGPRVADGLRDAMRVRAARPEAGARVIDLQYPDIMRDPISEIDRIYGTIGRTLTARSEAAMRDFLADNAKDKHGRHEYGLAQFDLRAEDVRDWFASVGVEYIGTEREGLQ